MLETFRFIKVIILIIIFVTICFGIASYLYVTQENDVLIKLREKDIAVLPSDQFRNIFWFVQISDIHVSSHHDPARIIDLREFMRTDLLEIIKPSFVLATGDLVDAKSYDDLSTENDVREWKSYNSILEESKITKTIPWLDLRGNHDCFDVKDKDHESNRFKTYSAMGKKYNLQSYKYVHQTYYGKYSFIGIDACPEPGLKRPFNFFGKLSDRDIVELRLMARETAHHNFTIWFAHYPTATLSVNYNIALKPALESTNTLAYLSGHLHHLGGITYNMYTKFPEGHLELELADWKLNRRYRILVIDHDLFSFIDTVYKKWPVIIITNPKDSRLSAPMVEPLLRVNLSTHIRILVFTPYKIENVVAFIDGIMIGTARHIEGPLFVLKWTPADYAQGLHILDVEVFSRFKKTLVTSYFSLDGQFPIYSIIANYILHSHPSSMIFYLFHFVWAIFIFTTLLSLFSPIKFESYIAIFEWGRAIKDYKRLSLIWFISNIYMIIGPWCIGEVNSHYSDGIIYLSGIQLTSGYISQYYMYGIALEQLLTFNIPSTLLLMITAWGQKIPRKYRNISDILLYGMVVNQLKLCYYFMRWLGWMGCILNPPTTWMLFLFIYTYIYIKRGNENQSL